MITKEKDKYLKEIYFSAGQPGSFGGVNRIWNEIKKDKIVSLSELKHWLSTQDTYSSNRQYIRKFKRPRIVVPYVDAVWGSDTAYMTQFQDENDGFGFFAVFIDIFSRFAWAYPLKTLTGKEMTKTLEIQFQNAKCEKLNTDSGTEYVNRSVKKFLESENVEHYTTKNETKQPHSERLIKQLKKILYKYMQEKRTRRWIDVLDKVVYGYNNVYHRSIKMTPAQAREEEEYTVWTNQYYKPNNKKRKSIKLKNKKTFKFKEGDRVKLSVNKKPFLRDFNQTFTTEIFTITNKTIKESIPMYSIKDESNDPIIGQFYEQELQKVSVSDDRLYEIEKIIRTRKKGGKKEYFVKFVGYPPKFNAWIDNVENI